MIYLSEDRPRAYQLRGAIFDARRRGLDPKQADPAGPAPVTSRHTDCCHRIDAPHATDAPNARQVENTSPRCAPRGPTTGSADRRALVLHLPTTLTNQDDAVRLATALRDSLAHVTALDFGEATLSEEDRQLLRARVWCDARLDGAGRCRHRARPHRALR